MWSPSARTRQEFISGSICRAGHLRQTQGAPSFSAPSLPIACHTAMNRKGRFHEVLFHGVTKCVARQIGSTLCRYWPSERRPPNPSNQLSLPYLPTEDVVYLWFQNASAASSMVVSAPASMRVLRSAVSGIRRSMKNFAVISLFFRKSSRSPAPAARPSSAAFAIFAHM